MGSNTYRATAEIPGGVRISLLIRPMFNLHSDWHRKLVIETHEGSLAEDLFNDTGWWRGSNLYLHKSGVYVLHEGQTGCIMFTVSPVALVPGASISCDKTDMGDNKFQEDDALPWVLPSRFYSDFQYIGHFKEAPRQPERIRFIGADKLSEPELPDIM